MARSRARPDDRARDRTRVALFAQRGDDGGEIALAGARDDVGRARAVAPHAHVERAVEPERKSARGLVELHRRNAEIEHDAVDRRALAATIDSQIREAILDQLEPACASSTSAAPCAIAL